MKTYIQDFVLGTIVIFLLLWCGLLVDQQVMKENAQAKACEDKGMVLIDSSSGFYCFEVPRGK